MAPLAQLRESHGGALLPVGLGKRHGDSSGWEGWVSKTSSRSRSSSDTFGKPLTPPLTPNEPSGYPMAKNLRSKIPKSDTLYIYDPNTAATSNFVKEVGSATEGQGGPVEIVANPREVAEKAVSFPLFPSSLPLPSPLYDEHVLSMI